MGCGQKLSSLRIHQKTNERRMTPTRSGTDQPQPQQPLPASVESQQPQRPIKPADETQYIAQNTFGNIGLQLQQVHADMAVLRNEVSRSSVAVTADLERNQVSLKEANAELHYKHNEWYNTIINRVTRLEADVGSEARESI